MRLAASDIIQDWGIQLSRADNERVLMLEPDMVKRWEEDLRHVVKAVTRLARIPALSIGIHARRFTQGAGETESAVTSAFMGRPDFVICDRQPKMLELNADSSVGGLLQISEYSELYQSSGRYESDVAFRSPMEGLAHFLEHMSPGADQIVVLVSSKLFTPYYQRVASKMCTWLASRLGRECVVCYPENLSVRGSHVTLGGRDVSVAIKLDTMIDESPQSELAALLKRTAGTRTVFVSDNAFINVEDKASLALLHALSTANSPAVTSREQAAIERLIPPTWLLSPHKPPRTPDWRAELTRYKDEYVIKRVFSFGGASVTTGRCATEECWRDAVEVAMREPHLWVAQEFVPSDRITFGAEFGHLQPHHAGSTGVRCVISPYVFDDAIAGFLCRTLQSETQDVIGLESSAPMGLCLVAERKELI